MQPHDEQQTPVVRDKLPNAIPLLPRTLLKSQQPISLMRFIQHTSKEYNLTESQSLSEVKPNNNQEKELPFRKLSELLINQTKESHSIDDPSFGFQYFNKDIAHFSCKNIPNVAQPSARVQFQSRFQSGNLLLAYQFTPTHYILIIRPDYNTTSYCQWFYFKISNKLDCKLNIKLSIVNMTKSASLFSKGMKILCNNSNSLDWMRVGRNIHYKQNQFKRKDNQKYFTLSWQISIDKHEQHYYAYSQPFTYSQLNKYLDDLQYSKYVRRTIVCRTLLRNRVDMLTISEGNIENKKIIVVTSRTHPAETVSSFVMNGLIDFLVSDNPAAKILRRKFVFKVIPMVNPDGVIHGNSRCSLMGLDLNRCWVNPSKANEVYSIKRIIVEASQSERLLMYCDLHGHSKKKNIFIYGCHDSKYPYASREFPFILSKISEPFSYKDCNFVVEQLKAGTARVSLWNKLKIPNIFTIESSFCSKDNDYKHLDERGYRDMGVNLCKAIEIYYANNYNQIIEIPSEKKTSVQLNTANTSTNTQRMKEIILKELKSDRKLIDCGLSTPSYSESEVEDNQIYEQISGNKKRSYIKIRHNNSQISYRSPKTDKHQAVLKKNTTIEKKLVSYASEVKTNPKTEQTKKQVPMKTFEMEDHINRQEEGEIEKMQIQNTLKKSRPKFQTIFQQEKKMKFQTEIFLTQTDSLSPQQEQKKSPNKRIRKLNQSTLQNRTQKLMKNISTFDFDQNFKKSPVLASNMKVRIRNEKSKYLFQQTNSSQQFVKDRLLTMIKGRINDYTQNVRRKQLLNHRNKFINFN